MRGFCNDAIDDFLERVLAFAVGTDGVHEMHFGDLEKLSEAIGNWRSVRGGR